MFIEQIYTKCLAEAAYYIESKGEAAIIDPLREVEPYIKMAQERGATIKYIFETHFHADFVSGHLDLANKTGASIIYGPNANTEYASYEAKDGEIFSLGDVKIKVIHTPGHTLESSCFLLMDENEKKTALFSGDTLFIGDVGRPDLAVQSNLTEKDLAGMLYDSLREKIMILPDDVIIYPAHGAGSSCGKNLSDETSATLGDQKQSNYALRAQSKEAFIEELTSGILPPPKYFGYNAGLNKKGYDSIDYVMDKGTNAISAYGVKDAIANGAMILDTRAPQQFAKSFIPGAINIGLDGMFAIWVGTVIDDYKKPLIVVSEDGREEESVLRLARVGFDNTIGFLHGGMEEWENAGFAVDSIRSITADEFADELHANPNAAIIDVRKPSEYKLAHIENAQNQALDFYLINSIEVPQNKTTYLHCQGGYRSMIAASLLKAKGYTNIVDIQGGFAAISKADFNIVSENTLV